MTLCVVVVVFIVSACSTRPKACTLIGGESGITFDLSNAEPLGLDLKYEACAAGVCDAGPATSGQVFAHLELEPEVHDVSITLTDSSGTTVFQSKVEPGPFSPEVSQPNGKGCAPALRTLRFSVAEDGSLAST
jgi:hypothetical protein